MSSPDHIERAAGLLERLLTDPKFRVEFSRDPGGTWGYSRVESEDEFARRYLDLLRVVRSLSMLAGFCYTQLADVEQEQNGLLTADRRPKLPLNRVRAVFGAPPLPESEPGDERVSSPL